MPANHEEDKTTIQSGEKAAESAVGKKGRSRLMLFSVIGVAAVAIGAVLAIFVVKPMLAGEPSGDAKTSQSDTKHSKKKGEVAGSLMYAVNNIVINPAGTGGARFLSISFGFELESKELEAEFVSKEAVIRDALITIVSSKTVAELTDPKQKEIMRFQIKRRISQLMKTEELGGVYYTDFVLQ